MSEMSERIAGLSAEEKRELAAQLLRKKATETKAPLSLEQLRLWFLVQLVPGNPVHNAAAAVRLRGALDLEALQRSLEEIARRHEVLRTALLIVEGQPYRFVSPAVSLRAAVEDLREVRTGERETEAVRRALRAMQLPFDLGQSPLARVTLLRLDDEDHLLAVTMHRIIADDPSLDIFLSELAALYAAFAAGRPSPLPELSLQFGELAAEQRQRWQGEELETQLAYWRRQLAGLPVLELLTDRPRPAAPSFRGKTLPFSLPPALTGDLRELSRREGVSLFTTLLAAFQTLLARYTGQDDVVVGTQVANRTRPETQGMMGLLANSLVLRTALSGNPTFRDLLARAREVCLGAWTHQELPFGHLVQELQPERDQTRNPLFQVAFVLRDEPAALDLPGLAVSLCEVPRGTAQVDLTLSLADRADGLTGSLDLNADLFEEETAARLLAHFRTLLAAVAADPGVPVWDVPLVTGEERRRILIDWNAVPADAAAAGLCVHDLFEAQVEKTPAVVAVIHGQGEMTYRELDRRADALACRLQARGAGPEVRVAVCLEPSADMLVAMLAVLKAGGVYVPLDPTLPRERLAFLIADAQAGIVVTRERWEGTLPSIAAAVICLEAIQVPERPERPVCLATPGNAAYVLYTSGSTGQPKGVCVTHRNLVCATLARYHYPEGVESPRLLVLVPFIFDASLGGTFWTLCQGGALVLPDEGAQKDASVLGDLIARHGVTHTQSVVSLYEMLLSRARPEKLASLRAVYVGGEPCLAELVERHFRRFPGVPLFNDYGPTEATIWSTVHRCHSAPPTVQAPIGRPIPGTQVYLLDSRLEPVPVGAPGEICVGGAGLARGYLGRPALTAERFIPSPFGGEPGERLYRTGDLARYLPDGDILFLGRADAQVKVRGYRIELGEIEAVLRQVPGLLEVTVIVREDVPGDRRLVAYAVPQEEAPALPELRRFLQERLPEYMVPSAFLLLDALPRTATGKLDRAALPAPDGTRPELDNTFVAPSTSEEEDLARIMAEILNVDRVGVNDSFFELGGDSLLFGRLFSQVYNAFGIELNTQSFFQEPTVAGVVRAIEASRRKDRAAAVAARLGVGLDELLSADAEALLSPAQQRQWFLEQLAPGNPVYNTAAAVRLRGALDRDALDRALGEIARRHEILRTSFLTVEGRPVPVVDADPKLKASLVDLRDFPADWREAEAARQATREAQAPFDVAQGPLARATLLRLDEDDHALVVTLHRMIADEESPALLLGELAALYESFAAGRPSPLPELPLQHAGFVAAQRRSLDSPALATQLSYWRRELAGLPVLELPGDRPRPPVPTFRGTSRPFTLGPALAASLRELCEREGASLFDLLLAGFQVLLSRHTGQRGFGVGVPAPSRRREELAALVGFVTNTVVLRADLESDPTVSELLARVREVREGAFAHAEVPFARLVQELQPERDQSRNPLFQVLFSLRPALPARDLAGLALTPWEVDRGTSELDVTLSMIEDGPALRGSFDYSTDLFEAASIERLVEHFQVLLAALAGSPGQRVSELPLASPAERRFLLVDWNDTAVERPGEVSMHELIAAQAAATPDEMAVACGERSLTYRELDRLADHLACELQARGVGPEVRVAVCLERSVDVVVSLLAVLKAGGAYVPLDPADPGERLAFVLQDAAVRVVLTRRRLLGGLPGTAADIVFVDALAAPAEPRRPAPGVTPDNTAYVIYTSGSTGRPKGVCVTHRSLVHSTAVRIRYFYPQKEEIRSLLLAPFVFDASGAGIYGTLCQGGALIIPEDGSQKDVAALATLIAARRITETSIVPSLFKLLLAQARPEDLATLRVVIVAGEPFPRDLAERALEVLPETALYNEYGPTEGTVWCTIYRLSGSVASAQVPIGRPISNAQIYLLDARLEPVPAGTPGELYIGGAGLARGYLSRPDLTAARFVPDPFRGEPGARLYRTGDLARLLSGGDLIFLGRADDQVKVRGYRIEPGEIEAALEQHAAVREAAVLVREDLPGERRLVAYAVPDGETPAIPELRRFLQTKLPDYMVPSAFVMLAAFPRTATGKLNRRALPAPDGSRPELESAYVAPRNPEEVELARIFSELTGVDRVGIHDNFFELGGSSLAFAQLFARVTESFQVELHVTSLFQGQTVERLAQAIDKLRQSGRRSSGITVLRNVDLEGEAVLDPAIQPDGPVFEDLAHPSRVFLTGATGFLGAFLLFELLRQTDAEVHCLVRAASPEEGRRRIQSTMEKYLTWDESLSSRIVAVPGDLAKPLLGIPLEQWQRMGREIDVIYHNGALVNFTYPYSVLKAPNVLGTQEVLRLACLTRVKPVHYVSTIDVFLSTARQAGHRIIYEEDALRADGVPPGYVQSKWVAEKLVRIARSRGLPACIYRPLQVTGHSQTGVFNETDAVYAFLKGYIQMGYAPEMELIIDVIPVDWVSRALIHVSRQTQSLGKIFHFANPNSMHWSDVVEWARQYGYPMDLVAYPEWRSMALRVPPDNALYSFKPAIPEDYPTPEQPDPGVNCNNTFELLGGTTIVCPPVDDRLLRVYAQRLIDVGYVEPPGAAQALLAGAAGSEIGVTVQ